MARRDVSFGDYHTTTRTVWRPAQRSFAPKYALDDRIYADLRAVERADHELRRFEADAGMARQLLREALARNAFGTASIEGNPLSLEDVESLLVRGPTPDALQEPDEREILNYAAFMDKLPQRTLPASIAEVRTLHRELFTGVLHDAGKLKARPNFIGRRPAYEVVFVPTMPERVEPELGAALRWLNEAPEHPLVKVQVFFYEFQGIHPFRDGNGRAGRALTTVALHALGYPGVRYALIDYEFDADRDGYYGALAQVQRHRFDLTPWISYLSGVLRRTFEGAVHRFLFREGLPKDMPERQKHVAGWFARLDRASPGRIVKFNDVHAAFPTVPARTLQRDLAGLRDAGVLRVQGDRKAATYRLATPPNKGSRR